MLPSALNNAFRVLVFVFLYTVDARVVEKQSVKIRDLRDLLRNSNVIYLSDLQSREDDDSADYDDRDKGDQDSRDENQDSRDEGSQDLSPLSADSSFDELGDQDSYLLYALIKTTQNNEKLDSNIDQKLEDTKNILRTKFIARCAKLDSCKQSCPPKKKNTCEEKCEDIYDAEDACEETTTTCSTTTTCRTTKTTKCRGTGKTMPPRWCKGQ